VQAKKVRPFLVFQSVLCVVPAGMLAVAAIGGDWPRRRLIPSPGFHPRKSGSGAGTSPSPIGAQSRDDRRQARDGLSGRKCRQARTGTPLSAGSCGEPRGRSERRNGSGTRQAKKLFYGGRAIFALRMVPVLLYLANGERFLNGDSIKESDSGRLSLPFAI